METKTMSIELIKQTAKDELYEKVFRDAVEAEKEKLRRKKPFLAKLFPWKILVIRRD